MTWNEFEKETNRLETQWSNGYGTERRAAFFKAFKNVDAQVFRDAVSMCLTTCRQAPLLEDLTKAIESCRGRVLNFNSGFQTAAGALQSLSTGGADPDFVLACKETLAKFQRGELRKNQFIQACDYLDQSALEFQKNRGISICRTCTGSGLAYTENTEGYRSVWRCTCRLGDGHSPSIPVFRPQLKPVQPDSSGRAAGSGT